MQEVAIYTKYNLKFLVSVLTRKQPGKYELLRFTFKENGKAELRRLGLVSVIGKYIDKQPTQNLETGIPLQLIFQDSEDRTPSSAGEIYDMILCVAGSTLKTITLESPNKPADGSKKRGNRKYR